jgi:hypothetical protein
MAPVAVELRNGQPASLTVRRKRSVVREITDTWREQGRWWEGEREGEFYLVLTDTGLRLLMHDLAGNKWYVKSVR